MFQLGLTWVNKLHYLIYIISRYLISNTQANILLFKFNKRNARNRFEICSKLTIKTPERRQSRSGFFIVNFKHVSYLFVVFLLLTLNEIVETKLKRTNKDASKWVIVWHWKAHLTHYALFRLLKLWQSHFGKSDHVGTIMDLFKAYNYISKAYPDHLTFLL